MARAIGSGPIAAGIGRVTNRGPGRVTITVRGFLIPHMAGYGSPARNGRQRGWFGVRVQITLAGRRVVLGA